MTNVYFISGFLANCKVFDRIKLPDGFKKQYIEWIIPNGDETLKEYARKMAQSIDQSSPFILLGYSFGGMVIQEMNKFLSPQKNIIIASIKNESETPRLHKIGQKINFTERFPMNILAHGSVVNKLYIKYIYHIPPSESNEFIGCTDPVYIKWSINQILNWKSPQCECLNLYHIHGTKDLAFPYSNLKNVDFSVENGDHLMIFKKYREINKILSQILLQY